VDGGHTAESRTALLQDLVAPILGASVGRLLAHEVGVRTDADTEDVHQLRVATRRLRADLRALRPVLVRREVTQLRDELGWLGSLAGPVRDADVLLARLSTAVVRLTGDDATVGADLLARLTAERADHRVALIAGMRDPRCDALLDALVDVVARPRLRSSGTARPASAVLARATNRQWHALLGAVARLGTSASITELHDVRIAAKRLRYTAETAEIAVGKPAARLAAAATKIQSTLGDLNDAVNAGLWLRRAADDPSVAVVAERLAATEDAAAEQLRAGWQQLWTVQSPLCAVIVPELMASVRAW
jgi:CHAD domain-containing protein